MTTAGQVGREEQGAIDARLPRVAVFDLDRDLPLLRACGHPVAVNPDRSLRRVAHRSGWPILTLD